MWYLVGPRVFQVQVHVSFFAVPPRSLHRLKGRLRSPRSTQVLSTRSLGLLNFASEVGLSQHTDHSVISRVLILCGLSAVISAHECHRTPDRAPSPGTARPVRRAEGSTRDGLRTHNIVCSTMYIYFIPEEGIEKRYREGLDGRVWGHWSVRGGAFCEPAKREGARIVQW